MEGEVFQRLRSDPAGPRRYGLKFARHLCQQIKTQRCRWRNC